MKELITARLRRKEPVFVCRKCLKRCENGTEIRRRLKRDLKHRRSGQSKPAKLVSTSCFGICPKRAVVLGSSKTLQKGELVLASHEDEITVALRALL